MRHGVDGDLNLISDNSIKVSRKWLTLSTIFFLYSRGDDYVS
jgi:hypothetical protein